MFIARVMISRIDYKSKISHTNERGLEYNSPTPGHYMKIEVLRKGKVIISSNERKSYVDFFKYYIERHNEGRPFTYIIVEKRLDGTFKLLNPF